MGRASRDRSCESKQVSKRDIVSFLDNGLTGFYLGQDSDSRGEKENDGLTAMTAIAKQQEPQQRYVNGADPSNHSLADHLGEGF